ncbi:MAG: beta-lactamase family protein [Acidobacteria bacterium]|nr:beta-lactamase family protein [Acidobacteriota bacterium]
MSEPISAVFTDAAERYKIPAAVGMAASTDRVLFTCSYGRIESHHSRPVDSRSIFAVASMTKAITSAAALQLVERNLVELDAPVCDYVPELGDLPLLEGFDDAGKPRFSQTRYNVTLRQLLTHTAGFAYSWSHPLALRYRTADEPFLISAPGTRWDYGTSIDWVGKLVESVSNENLEAYFQRTILQPLDMNDTGFQVLPDQFDRLVSFYQRDASGVLTEAPRVLPPAPAWFNGGGGLFSTAEDYVRFMQMILRRGRAADGEQVLPEAVVLAMSVNQVGTLRAGRIESVVLERSRHVDFHPGEIDRHTFGFLMNDRAYAGGRSAGSLGWAGIRNTFYWIDPARGIAAVLLMQFQPFCDEAAMNMLREFERAVYTHIE